VGKELKSYGRNEVSWRWIRHNIISYALIKEEIDKKSGIMILQNSAI